MASFQHPLNADLILVAFSVGVQGVYRYIDPSFPNVPQDLAQVFALAWVVHSLVV